MHAHCQVISIFHRALPYITIKIDFGKNVHLYFGVYCMIIVRRLYLSLLTIYNIIDKWFVNDNSFTIFFFSLNTIFIIIVLFIITSRVTTNRVYVYYIIHHAYTCLYNIYIYVNTPHIYVHVHNNNNSLFACKTHTRLNDNTIL